MTTGIRLFKRDKDPMRISLALKRVEELLCAEGWTASVERRDPEALAPDSLEGRAPHFLYSWDLRVLATQGRLDVWRTKGSLRVRYRPTRIGFVVTAWAIGYFVGWPIREYVQHLTVGQEPADWFNGWQRDAWQYATGLLLAYPLLRWRFTRMCRKAVRLNQDQWKRYASAAHFWRRTVAAGPFAWWFIEAVYTWIELGRGAFGWLFVQMLLFGVATFAIDWDVLFYELPRRTLAAISKRYTD